MPFIFLLIFNVLNPNKMAQLTLTLTNIEQAKGNFYLSFYDKKNSFLKSAEAVQLKIVPANSVGSQQIFIENLPLGDCALAVFQDLNGNGKMDTNFLGIPTEPYGFSKNVRPKYRAARWEECKFLLTEGSNEIVVRLEKW